MANNTACGFAMEEITRQRLPPAENKEAFRGIFITTDLAIGGAEVMLFRLLSRIDGQRYTPTVISLKKLGPLSEELRNLGIPVYSLNWESSSGSVAAVPRLARLVKKLRPNFVHGWMYHGNVAAELARMAMHSDVPVLWNIRHSLHSPESDKRSTNALVRLLARFSSRPEWIVYNSRTAAQQHERIGYDALRTKVIPNGFDCDMFRPRPECRNTMRASLGLAPDVPLIGLAARVHPVKDHGNFLRAAHRMVSLGSPAHFLLMGKGTEDPGMADRIEALGLQGRVHALGERRDMPELTAALDVATCCSRSEAFPNAIGEAMACGVPCVATDVGECKRLVGDTGRIIPCGDPDALSAAWQEILGFSLNQRRSLGEAARGRILQEFSLDQIVLRYERLYAEVVQSRRG